MPTAANYRRAPLVDLAFVPLSDAAVHSDGLPEMLTRRLLPMVDLTRMSPLDAILATKLGGYTEAPPMPDVEAAMGLISDHCAEFILTMRAAAMIASMRRDKQAMLRVLAGMRAFLDAVPDLSEETLISCGADALRLTLDVYRRTGQDFLLHILEALRSQLPDVSGVMHVFPFQRAYQPDANPRTPDEEEYYARMQRLATGKLTADALAMTSLLAQYSGSGRDSAAARVGLAALQRYHGMPCGAFSADPYLAGRDPAHAVELDALCAQIEAYADALFFCGEPIIAEKLERLLVNALPDMLLDGGVRALQSTNRLANDESCFARKPERAEVSALLRALYALRRCVWLSKDDETLAYMLPVSGGCLTRVGGVPIRFVAKVSGTFEKTIVLSAECARPTRCNLLLRIPGYADAAFVSVSGGRRQPAPLGELFRVTREFKTNDTITLTLSISPKLESGFRGSVSVVCGAELMALALPDISAAWRYALAANSEKTPVESDGVPQVLTAACEAPMWREKNGFVLPPPQGVPMSANFELTLIPYAGTNGRIAVFPVTAADA